MTVHNQHRLVEAEYGKASQYPCADGCGKQALDWSHTHDTDRNNINNYKPRCRSCHTKYDGIGTDKCEPGCRCGRHLRSGPTSKFTERDLEIILDKSNSRMELAKMFNVTPQYIGQVRKGCGQN
jgi:hypothetical protein